MLWLVQGPPELKVESIDHQEIDSRQMRRTISRGACCLDVTNSQEHTMRVPALPTIASFILLAAPALAQTSTMTGGQLSDTSTSSRLPPDTAVTLDTQQKLKQSLEQNGFKKVVA
jgi:hypothetical protein